MGRRPGQASEVSGKPGPSLPRPAVFTGSPVSADCVRLAGMTKRYKSSQPAAFVSASTRSVIAGARPT
jgi:hypothetical protein